MRSLHYFAVKRHKIHINVPCHIFRTDIILSDVKFTSSWKFQILLWKFVALNNLWTFWVTLSFAGARKQVGNDFKVGNLWQKLFDMVNFRSCGKINFPSQVALTGYVSTLLTSVAFMRFSYLNFHSRQDDDKTNPWMKCQHLKSCEKLGYTHRRWHSSFVIIKSIDTVREMWWRQMIFLVD